MQQNKENTMKNKQNTEMQSDVQLDDVQQKGVANFEGFNGKQTTPTSDSHISQSSQEEPIMLMKADKAESVTQNQNKTTPKKANNMKFVLMGVGVVGVLAISTIVAKFAGVFDPPQPMSQIQRVQQTQVQTLESLAEQQSAEQAQIQPMENRGTKQVIDKPITPTMPALEPVGNTAHKDNHLYYDESKVGGVIQSNSTLEFDAMATEKVALDEETPKPKILSIEEQLMQKPLNQLSNEELVMAYQIVDQQLTKDTDTHFAIINRMKDVGIKAPVSQLEVRQLQREKRLIEENTRMIVNKFATDLQLLAQRMEELNTEQVNLSRNVTAAVSNVMQRIDVEDIKARQNKAQQIELTKANQGTLKRFKITQMLGGRVWISIDNKLPKTYVVGDSLTNDTVITGIDLDKKSVITNKGTIN